MQQHIRSSSPHAHRTGHYALGQVQSASPRVVAGPHLAPVVHTASNHSSAVQLTSPALAAASQQYEGIYSNLHASCPRRSSCPSHLMSPLSVRIACSTHPARTVRWHQTQRSSTSLSPGPTPSPQPEPLPRLPIATRSSSRSSLSCPTRPKRASTLVSPRPPSRLSTQPFRPFDGGGRVTRCCSHARALRRTLMTLEGKGLFEGREDAHIVLGTHGRAVLDAQQ